MIYVGIDIAKQKHFASVMSADGEVLIQPVSFTNDIPDFSLFFKSFLLLKKNLWLSAWNPLLSMEKTLFASFLPGASASALLDCYITEN